MTRWCAVLVVGLVVTQVGLGQDNVMKIEITGVHHGAPLTIPLSVPKEWAKFEEVAISVIGGGDPLSVRGQLTDPGITTEKVKPTKEGLVRRDLHLITPNVPVRELHVRFAKTDGSDWRFAWAGKKGEYEELIHIRKGKEWPVLRYMNRPYDASSPDARNKSYKVFHHLYDPAGTRIVTNGGHTDKFDDPKKLLYPHHRGLMYGFNKCTFGPDLKKKSDTWHCQKDDHVAHEKTLSTNAGSVLGRHRVQLGWFGEKNERFAEEERELTVYHVGGSTLVEFASRLKAVNGKIRVDGDPQHAGFQFRAHNDVAAKTKGQTFYQHHDGTKGELGKERNWPGDKAMVDLPWYAMSFVLEGQRYTACYLNHPDNPKETRFSERDYGRFGGYFARDITPEGPLVVHYRLWLQTDGMAEEQGAALHRAFTTPPKLSIK